MNESEILEQVFSHGWPTGEDLVLYAIRRHGFGGDDGFYGVTYPDDLDEYQVEVKGEFIPEGFVEINYWDGEHKEIQVPELRYLESLKDHLRRTGLELLAEKLANAKQENGAN